MFYKYVPRFSSLRPETRRKGEKNGAEKVILPSG